MFLPHLFSTKETDHYWVVLLSNNGKSPPGHRWMKLHWKLCSSLTWTKLKGGFHTNPPHHFYDYIINLNMSLLNNIKTTAKALGHRCLNSVSVNRTEDEVMADVRGSAPPGFVCNMQMDPVSSTGAQICNVGNIMTVWFRVLRLETACGQEHDQMSTAQSVGCSGMHFIEVQKKEQKLEVQKCNMYIRVWRNNTLLKILSKSLSIQRCWKSQVDCMLQVLNLSFKQRSVK